MKAAPLLGEMDGREATTLPGEAGLTEGRLRRGRQARDHSGQRHRKELLDGCPATCGPAVPPAAHLSEIHPHPFSE